MQSRSNIPKTSKQFPIIRGIAYSVFKRASLLLLLILTILSTNIYAQNRYREDNEEAFITLDEISVLVRTKGLNEFYLSAIYTSDDLLYVGVDELFNTLGIPCTIGEKGESLSGFTVEKREPYLIDYNRQRVSVGNKSYSSKRGLIFDKGILYMESSLFVGTFGIAMNFNFRTLTLMVTPNFELPIIKQQRIEALRKNVEKIKGMEVPDTTVSRNYHFFTPGMFDWSVASYQKWKGATDNRFSFGAGVEFLYGEADFRIDYYSRYKFDDRNFYYLWRWVDNDKVAIRQAQVGRICNQTIAFINSPIIGASIRNTPTTIRKAKGYHTINEVAEPNWTVELYINNVLADYTKTDASGAYTFKVPMVYGYTTLKLKFYGPLGEERTEERIINIPYSVMPTGEFEYGLSGGVVQDSSNSRFGRAEFNYGFNRFITIGGGLEYLSSIQNGAYIPFAKATVQPFSKMILSGEYDHRVATRGLLSYYFWKDALIELDYAKFVKGQLATRFNAPEERRARLSVPFRIRNFVFLSRLDLAEFRYKSFSFYQANTMLSLYYRQLSVNSSTLLNWTSGNPAFVTSSLSMSYRLRNGFMIRPSAYGNLTDGKLISWKIDLEKSIRRGYLSASYERYVAFNDNFINLSFKYDLSFARTNLMASRTRSVYYTGQSAQGSLAFGGGNNYVYASNNPSVSKGGIAIYPFLDLNQNGLFDKDEHMVKLTSVKVLGGKVVSREKDSIIRIADLNAFVSYMVEFNDNYLDNISWRFKYKAYKVLVDPNQFKRVDVPINVVGEANGMVYLNNQETVNGIGRILVKIYRKGSSKAVAEILSESDGYISYIGLAQGDYVVCIDSTQLQRLEYVSTPTQIPFSIKALEEGDVVSNLNFTLKKKATESALVREIAEYSSTIVSTSKPNSINITAVSPTISKNKKDTSMFLDEQSKSVVVKDDVSAKFIKTRRAVDRNTPAKLMWGDECTLDGYFYIQCGSYRKMSNAINKALNIKKKKGIKVGVVMHRGFYKVRVGCVPSERNALSIKRRVAMKDSSDEPLIVKKKINKNILTKTP